MSTHRIEVRRVVEIHPHPNAERLDIIPIGGHECAVVKDSLKIGDLICYFEPDTLIPTDREEFSILASMCKTYSRECEGVDRTYYRIKVKKLRGRYSQGYICLAPPEAQEGEDMWSHYECVRYEPVDFLSLRSPFCEKGPGLKVPHYDLENIRNYMGVLKEGEAVHITAKIHGANAGFVFSAEENRMFCKSRRQWKMPPGVPVGNDLSPNTPWWECLNQNPWIEEWCRDHPDQMVFGELYGNAVQKGFHYGDKINPGVYGFRVFDILIPDESHPLGYRFIDSADLHHGEEYAGLRKVPLVYEGPFNFTVAQELAEAPETFGGSKAVNHVREGVVIKPIREREEGQLGRVALKLVSMKYLEKD